MIWKPRCDEGNIFGRGCENDRTHMVKRVYRDGATIVTHECDEHAGADRPKLVVSMSTPLKRAA